MQRQSISKKQLQLLANKLLFLLQHKANESATEIKQLIQQINELVQKLYPLMKRRELKRILGAVAIFIGVSFTQEVHAQAAFAPPITNPFGLSSAYQLAFPIAVDMDNDGDMDILAMEYYGNFKYYKNNGTNLIPLFAAATANPFGLTPVSGYFLKITAADLDNDGDLDIMAADYNPYTSLAAIKYYQNTGTPTSPAFAAPVSNPFGIVPSGAYIILPELADLDNDGDYDLLTAQYNPLTYATEFKYYQNTGSVTAPSFGASVTNPFGLSVPNGLAVPLTDMADVDNDGDLDLIFGEFYSTGNFNYRQNIGTAAVPNFAAVQINPFGLVATNQSSPYSKLNAPAFIDMDGDGDFDILSGEYYGALIYFKNTLTVGGPLTINLITINTPSCSPGGDGTVAAIASGGMGPITYRIGTDSNTTGNFTALTTGNYTLTVRDSVNTIKDSAFTINASTPPAWDFLNTFLVDVSCNGANDGLILLAATGGAPPITYTLVPGGSNTNGIFSPLSGGTYVATINDSKNCTDTAVNFTIINPPAINLVVDSSTNILCNGSSTGAIYTTTSGGSGGFTWSIAPGLGAQTTPGDYINLPAGSYAITATDINGCSATVSQSLTQAPALLVGVTGTINASSSSAADGTISSVASGGTPVITYSISPAGGTQSPPGTFTGLTTGNYTITATDANGCTKTTTTFLNFDMPSGLEEYNQAQMVKVHPNPFDNSFVIQSDKKIESVSILDMTGRILIHQLYFDGSIPAGDLPKGIYMLKVYLKDGEAVTLPVQKK